MTRKNYHELQQIRKTRDFGFNDCFFFSFFSISDDVQESRKVFFIVVNKNNKK